MHLGINDILHQDLNVLLEIEIEIEIEIETLEMR